MRAPHPPDRLYLLSTYRIALRFHRLTTPDAVLAATGKQLAATGKQLAATGKQLAAIGEHAPSIARIVALAIPTCFACCSCRPSR